MEEVDIIFEEIKMKFEKQYDMLSPTWPELEIVRF